MTRHPRTLSFAAAAAALAIVSTLTSASAQTKPAGKVAAVTPVAFVTAFYRGHFAQHQRWDLTEKRERKNFTAELVSLLDEDLAKQAANPDEVVGLDFNPVTNAQDDATRFKVGTPTVDGDDTIVPVSIYFGTERRTVRVRLTLVSGSWKIANFLYEEGDLLSILKEPS